MLLIVDLKYHFNERIKTMDISVGEIGLSDETQSADSFSVIFC